MNGHTIEVISVHMHLGSGTSSRPALNQETFAPLAPVRPAPQPPGSESPAPDIPPRPPATKQKDAMPTPPPKVALKPPVATGKWCGDLCQRVGGGGVV